ncbi:tetratricopeptide repeat-containing sensor histidine kinase [Marinoscillum sp.]|uniref:tetratricopeptide repeat-containing sensor histidine kinase n=1 Tax=Marinoscillum sp. TaxID=2024838 RepID=UPI003BA886AD
MKYFTVTWFVFFVLCALLTGQTVEMDSLTDLLKKDLKDEDRIRTINRLTVLLNYSDPEAAANYNTQALKSAESIGDSLLIIETLLVKVSNLQKRDELDSATSYCNRIIKYTSSSIAKYPNQYIDAISKRGIIYHYQTSYAKAIQDHTLAIKLATQYGSRPEEATARNNLGLTYWRMKEYQSAIEQFEKSLEIREAHGSQLTNDISNMAGTIGNIASVYFDLGEMEKVVEYDLKALELHKSVGNKYGQGIALNNLGEDYLMLGDLTRAKTYYTAALKIRKELARVRDIASTMTSLGQLYLNQGDLQRSENYLLQALHIADSINDLQRQLTIYDALIKLNKEKDDFETALQYFAQKEIVNDSLFNERKSQEIQRLRVEFESEQQEQQLGLQQEQIARVQAELGREATFRNMLILGTVLLLIIVALIYRSERIKTRKNQQIESLLKEIHHRVKNNLQVISSLLNMQSRGLEDQEMLDAIKEGQSRVKAMSLIHEKLYQTDNVASIDFASYTLDLLTHLEHLYKPKELALNKQIDMDQLNLDIDTAIPIGLMLNELISNAFKYAFKEKKEGKLHISLKRLSGDLLDLQVKDDGIGLPEHALDTTTKSLGLRLINILTKQLKGEMTYQFEGGATFQFRLRDLKYSG